MEMTEEEKRLYSLLEKIEKKFDFLDTDVIERKRILLKYRGGWLTIACAAISEDSYFLNSSATHRKFHHPVAKEEEVTNWIEEYFREEYKATIEYLWGIKNVLKDESPIYDNGE